MQLDLLPGQTVGIAAVALSSGATRLSFSVLERAAPEVPVPVGKRGPKSLPKSNARSADFQPRIMKLLRNGKPRTSDEIRAALGETPETKNAISWAFVDLQHARKGGDRKGPLEKLPDGRYQKRWATASA